MSSNEKGKVFERKVVGIIRKEFNLSNKECYRTPISGGHPYIYKSDIIFENNVWDKIKLFIECKYRSKTKDWDFEGLIDSILEKSLEKLNHWKPVIWLETARSKCPEKYLPILVFGKSYSSIYVLVSYGDIKRFISYGDIDFYILIANKYLLLNFTTFLTQWRRVML